MTEEVKELLSKLVIKVCEASENTKHDFNFSLCGPTKGLYAYYFENGCDENKEPIYLADYLLLDKDYSEEKLKEALEKIEELEGNK